MTGLFKRKNIPKHWTIVHHQKGILNCIELTDHARGGGDIHSMFRVFLDRLLHDEKFLSISQVLPNLVDKDQNVHRSIDQFRHHPSIKFIETLDYGSDGLGRISKDSFAVHLLGKASDVQMLEILGYGWFTLPNILYTFDEDVADWPQQIFDLNQILVQWFWHKLEDRELLQSMTQPRMVLWTSDGHLEVLVRDPGKAGQILSIIQEIAREQGIEINLTE